MHFGKAVKKVMVAKQISVQDLADKLGCSKQNIYETFWKESAQLRNVQSYAKALKVKPFELVKIAEQIK